jgi:hypothetical protein
MSETARRAERIALALVMGDAPITPDTIADLRLANREREVEQCADALQRFRSGENVWSWPVVAPWAGTTK